MLHEPISCGTEVGGCTIHDLIMTTANSSIYDATPGPSRLSPADEGKLVFKHLNPNIPEEFMSGELEAIQALRGCPNAVLGFEAFEIAGSFGYFMKKCHHGDLLDLILSASLPEDAVAQMSHRILVALAHMHAVGYAHRDIKLENILLHGGGSIPDTFLADFGYAARLENGYFTTVCGTPAYPAPELRREEPYGIAVDMWAFGVLVFVMVTGRMPFPEIKDEPDEFEYRVQNGDWDREMLEEGGASDEVIDLITGCLEVDPGQRLTAEEAARHAFYAWTPVPDETKAVLVDMTMGLDEPLDVAANV
jgi:serine/threonine protein kinase